jgi:hypothetical protein
MDIDTISLQAAKEIEDAFCQPFEGGRTQRLAALQVIISRALATLWDRRVEMIAQLTIQERDREQSRTDGRTV